MRQHVVVALGGNAILERGDKDVSVANQRRNIAKGMQSLSQVVNQNTTTIVHGNGPQVGLLLLENAAYLKQQQQQQQQRQQQQLGLDNNETKKNTSSSTTTTQPPPTSLDVLDAETEGQIGYLIESELRPYLVPQNRSMVTLLSQIVVDANDPSMIDPTKFVGPVYATKEEADRIAAADPAIRIKPDGAKGYRRVVPSPQPLRMVENQMRAVRRLRMASANSNNATAAEDAVKEELDIEDDTIVICAGGGGIPVIEELVNDGGENSYCYYRGIEAVIDKDRAAAMVGNALKADGLLILTDVPAVAVDYESESRRKWIRRASPSALETLAGQGHFPAGSMGPKIESAIDFVRRSDDPENAWAAIGSLHEAPLILQGKAGTTIRRTGKTRDDTGTEEDFIEYYEDKQDRDQQDHPELEVG